MERQVAAQRLDDLQRPRVLDDLTVTQLAELERQADEGDRDGFAWRAESFGWTPEQADEAWAWLQAGDRTGAA